MARSEFVLDELLCFLGSPLFQVPAISYMETHCLIFDPNEELPEYRMVHEGYRALVTVLLEAFRADTGLSTKQIMDAVTDMNKKPDLRGCFQEIFEHLLASEDYALFRTLMGRRNLELQVQALALITKQMGGQLPESLKTNKAASKMPAPKKDTKGGGEAPPAVQEHQHTEHEVFQAVMNSQQSEPEAAKPPPMSKKMAEVIQNEAEAFAHIKDKETEAVQKAMKEMVIEESPKPAAAATKAPAPVPAKKEPLPPPKIAVMATKGGSSQDAANSWLQSALAENKDSKPLQKAVEGLQQLSPEELAKRQKFLQEQRAKLVAMKQKEREKHLTTYEQSKTGSSRPKSARAARSAMTAAPAPSDEDEKKMAMRKAIAARLKNEVVGKKD